MSGDKRFKMRRIPDSKPGQQVQLVGAVSAAEGSQPHGDPSEVSWGTAPASAFVAPQQPHGGSPKDSCELHLSWCCLSPTEAACGSLGAGLAPGDGKGQGQRLAGWVALPWSISPG